MIRRWLSLTWLLCLSVACSTAQTNRTFTVAAYNVANWNTIDRRSNVPEPKPQAEKDSVVEVIAAVRPDVIGLEEMGTTNDFAELRALLAAKGLDYPHWEHVQAHDNNRHVCLLSRFPIVQRHSRTDYTYNLGEKTLPVGRGFLDVVIQVNDHYSFRAVVVHLKSKRQTDDGDQALMRLEEAKLLRAHLGKILKKDPATNLIAMGDFNDGLDSASTKIVVGEPPFQLTPLPCKTDKGYVNTHYWATHKQWSRIDFLMVNPGLSKEFVDGTARIYEGPSAGKASDHRLISAEFRATE